MLKNNYVINALILIGTILYNSATAQELDIPEAHYPKLPKYAATANGFVPHGWTLEIKKLGDLNGDGRPDLVLLLHEKSISDDDPWSPRILAVAFAKPGGGYALAIQNHTIIGPHCSSGCELYDAMDSGGISVVRGNLRVVTGFFATTMGNRSYTFRYQRGGFELIGYDEFFIVRMTAETEATSINYLTGKIKTTTNKGGKENEDKDKVQWKKVSSLKPIPIADVDGTNFAPDY